MHIMDESGHWLPFLSFNFLNFDYIQTTCIAIMSKKFPPSEKYREEISEIDQGRLHCHERDVQDRGLLVSNTTLVSSVRTH